MSDNTPQQTPKTFKPPMRGQSILVDGKYYFIGDKIDQGSFGEVFECQDEWSNQLVAKVLLPRNRTYDAVRESWLQELRKLLDLRHPNITHVHAAFECDDTFYLVIERCSMTLDTIIGTPGGNGETWLPYVARDILQGLEYSVLHTVSVFGYQSAHRCRIICRRPENIGFVLLACRAWGLVLRCQAVHTL